LGDALHLARNAGVDLVEIAPNATPPVCRLVDYGKFRYEQAKKEKESRKHQHATRVKEVHLSPKIDPHDLGVKIEHAVDFLSEDMKVKITLKFRGREMAHTEYGFQVVQKFLAEIAAFGHPDFEPKLIGRGINVMISPLPRNKRPKNPRLLEPAEEHSSPEEPPARPPQHQPAPARIERQPKPAPSPNSAPTQPGFANNPFAEFEVR
jgi:translation initiation factor IF-3